MKLSRKKTKRQVYVCIGGPWHGLTTLLPRETMIMTANSRTGRYVEGVWEDV